MSISWVCCRSKMGVPFNRFLCLETSKRDSLSVFLWCPFSSLEDAENDPRRTPVPSPIYGQREIMSIGWVCCQSKMGAPFNRLLCLQTSKRDSLSVSLWCPFSSLEDAENDLKGHLFHRPYMGRERNHEHQLGLLPIQNGRPF